MQQSKELYLLYKVLKRCYSSC